MSSNPFPLITQANGGVLASLVQQISDLQPGVEKRVEIAAILADLGRVKELLSGLPADVPLSQRVEDGKQGLVDQVKQIQSGATPLSGFGKVLVDLYSLQQALAQSIQQWLDNQQTTDAAVEPLKSIVLGIIWHHYPSEAATELSPGRGRHT
jgi:hypothetical protein